MKKLGASVLQRPDHEIYLWGFPEGIHLMAGFGALDGRLETGPSELTECPTQLGVGSYAYLDVSRDVTRVRADPGGNHVLYYGSGILTNRLHLAALIERRINFESALATVHSNHMFCQQFGVISTPVEGISLALPGEWFEVDDDVSIRESGRVAADFFEPLDPIDYRRLIQRGASELVENIEAIVDGSYPVLSDITGGQDSRVVLGALIAAGRVKDVVFNTKFSEEAAILTATVNTNEAIRRKRADFEIGTGLVRRFGGTFEPRPVPDGYLDTTIAENLRVRRSQRFGSYHFTTGQILSTRRPRFEVPYVRMTGGSGELYRDYYQRYFTSIAPDEAFERGLVRNMLAATFNSALPVAMLRSMEGSYIDTFDRLPGVTVGQRLDAHYRSFRNRYHFGANHSRSGNALSISPLNSPSLLRAASGLPEAEKATGRVLFDVTKALCEELPYYPYDKEKHGRWSESDFHVPSRFDDAPPQLPTGGPLPQSSPSTAARSVNRLPSLSLAISLHCVGRLRSSAGPFGLLGDESFEDYLERDVGRRPTRLASWSSRLQAFVDYLDIAEGALH